MSKTLIGYAVQLAGLVSVLWGIAGAPEWAQGLIGMSALVYLFGEVLEQGKKLRLAAAAVALVAAIFAGRLPFIAVGAFLVVVGNIVRKRDLNGEAG